MLIIFGVHGSVQALEPEYEALAEHMAGSQVRIAKYQADVDREFANASLGLKTFPSIVYYPKVRKEKKKEKGGNR